MYQTRLQSHIEPSGPPSRGGPQEGSIKRVCRMATFSAVGTRTATLTVYAQAASQHQEWASSLQKGLANPSPGKNSLKAQNLEQVNCFLVVEEGYRSNPPTLSCLGCREGGRAPFLTAAARSPGHARFLHLCFRPVFPSPCPQPYCVHSLDGSCLEPSKGAAGSFGMNNKPVSWRDVTS